MQSPNNFPKGELLIPNVMSFEAKIPRKEKGEPFDRTLIASQKTIP
jgi:hypothetical protein